MESVKICIIEDEKINLIFLEKLFEMAGYSEVCCARSAEEALVLIHENPPDLLLVDYSLKGTMNGVQLVEEVRKSYYLPVVFLTAAQEAWVLEDIGKIDKSLFLAKPFEREELFEKIEALLSQAHGTTPL